MDGWMDGCTALVPVRYTVCPGPVAFAVFPRLITAFPPHPLHALEHALSGRIHSFFHASTYWLIVCACALLSPLFSPLPPFTLSFSLVAPWCGAPHSCLPDTGGVAWLLPCHLQDSEVRSSAHGQSPVALHGPILSPGPPRLGI